MAVGIGIPIPILDEEVLEHTLITDQDIYAPVVDYSQTYPNRGPDVLGWVTYAQLRSGKIQLNGKEIPTASLSSYARARSIAQTLKTWIQQGSFLLTEPVAQIPGPESGYQFRPCKEKPVN